MAIFLPFNTKIGTPCAAPSGRYAATGGDAIAAGWIGRFGAK